MFNFWKKEKLPKLPSAERAREIANTYKLKGVSFEDELIHIKKKILDLSDLGMEFVYYEIKRSCHGKRIVAYLEEEPLNYKVEVRTWYSEKNFIPKEIKIIWHEDYEEEDE